MGKERKIMGDDRLGQQVKREEETAENERENGCESEEQEENNGWRSEHKERTGDGKGGMKDG